MKAQQQNRISMKRQGNLWDIGCIIQIKSIICNKNKICWRSHAWPRQNSLNRYWQNSHWQWKAKKRKKVGGKMIRVEGAKCFSLYKFCQSSASCFCFPLPAHLLDGEQVSWKIKGCIDNVKSCEELLVMQTEEGKKATWFLNSQAIHRWVVAAKRVKKCCL